MASVAFSPALAKELGPALPPTPASELGSESASLFELDSEPDSDVHQSVAVAIPRHPIPAMQDAFAESLIEATRDPAREPIVEKPKLRCGDANTRRKNLLDQDKSEPPPAAQWRFRPGQRNHELRKLMAQISFGVYLLLNGMANSNESAVSILQGHIDEVDEFLETTMEDIALATADITDRIEYLKVPMTNMDFFEKMLENRDFRLQIIEGNETIEHILSRTSTALVQSNEDITEGLKATREFTLYLAEQQNGIWRSRRPDVVDIFDAMKGNTEGWLNAFLDLQVKDTTLNALLVKLGSIVSEIDRRAGEVSRRTRFSIQPYSTPTHSRTSSGNSGSSSQRTPRASPPQSRRPKSPPPRLSLGLGSDLGSALTDSAYFELPSPKEVIITTALAPVKAEPVESIPEHDEEAVAQPDSETKSEPEPQPEPANEVAAAPEASEVVITTEATSTDATSEEPKIAAETEVAIPLELDEDPTSDSKEPRPQTQIVTDSPTADEAEDHYLLQPRTYTPLPPAPEPSPTVFDRSPGPTSTPLFGGRAVPHFPTRSEGTLDANGRSAEIRIEQGSDRPASTPQVTSGLASPGPTPSSPEKQLPQKKTSLRQRVALKTNPPESILVPPRSMAQAQRPIYSSPKYYTPDSAYGSDMERPNMHSHPEGLSPPPRLRPPLVPSPQSDQQYFRPVQASPHSPLQQRPHTAGTVRAPPYQQHHRNAPSRMGGMSMLSTVTTMNPDAPNGRRLKKKKSAFGWLKKAFSLDEEERAAFEQRKREEARNLYHESRGNPNPFLDGKRVR